MSFWSDAGFQGGNGGADAEAISAVAEVFGAVLPDDYHTFLQAEGESGGRFSPREILVFASSWGVQDTVVTSLFGARDVAETTRELRSWNRLPGGCVLIGEDPAGNYLVLSGEAGFEGVWFWDHERENPQQANTALVSDFQNTMSQIASSFAEFVAALIAPSDAALRAQTLASQPLPPMPAPAPELPAGIKPPYRPGPLIGPADAIQVYRQSSTYKQRDTGHPVTDFLNARFYDEAGARSVEPGPMLEGWEAPTLGWVRDDDTVDLPHLCEAIALRPRARDALAELLEPYGELLPLDTETGTVWAFRCLNVVDALDPTARTTDGYLGRDEIHDYRFVPEVVADAGIFIVPQQKWAPELFFNRQLAQKILDADIRCPPFNLIWTAS